MNKRTVEQIIDAIMKVLEHEPIKKDLGPATAWVRPKTTQKDNPGTLEKGLEKAKKRCINGGSLKNLNLGFPQ